MLQPQTERIPFCEWLRLLSPQHGWATGIQRTAVQSTAHTDPFPDLPKVNPQGTSWTKPSITLSWFEPLNSSRAVSSTSELQKHSHLLLTACSLVSRTPSLQDALHHTNQEESLLPLLPTLFTVLCISFICLFFPDWLRANLRSLSSYESSSTFSLMYFNYAFLYLLVLPCPWLLQAVFQIWVKYVSRC